MFTISINGRFLAQKVTGVQRHAIEATNAIIELLNRPNSRGATLAVVAPAGIYTSSSKIPIHKTSRVGGHIWEQVSLPFRRRGVLVNLCNTYPLLVRKQIVVVHDAAIYALPEGYTRSFSLFYRALFWLLRFKSSTRILTDSEFSRREIARYTGIASSRITVVYCGADHWHRVVPDVTVIERLGLAGRRYLLAVASANPNKNLPRLVQAYASLSRPDVPLVLVGGHNNKVFASEQSTDLASIIKAGYVSDAELAALYSSAAGFVFPSLYEGFGLPPLEAMTFGCPVLSSREASLPEVCGEAALYCNAFDPTDIAAAMRRLLDDADLRADLIANGYQQIEKFKWKNTAQAILDIAREIS